MPTDHGGERGRGSWYRVCSSAVRVVDRKVARARLDRVVIEGIIGPGQSGMTGFA